MPNQRPSISQQYKEDAVRYSLDHPELTLKECAQNLGVGLSSLGRWRQKYMETNGIVPTRGSGNYSSDEQKEIARLRRELRDTQDALDVLKKAISILGKD